MATFADLFTHTRASTATYVDSSGNLQTAAVDEPRVNHHIYDGTQWVNEGILHESEARTNLVLNSGTLSTQNVTVANVVHTLHFTGTGTVTLSGTSTAGPLVGTGAGENNRVSLTFTPTAGTLTLTVSGTVTNAQLEAGSTPSSYIPTAGSQVTRAADSMTIPAAKLPYPEPVVIGSELVTNGTFDTDTDWTLGTGWTISGGLLEANALSGNFATQSGIGLVSGRTYTLSFDVVSRVSGNIVPRLGSGPGFNITSISAVGSYSFTVTAGASDAVEFAPSPSFEGTLDNVSVKEINPLSLSIAMEGLETFADLDTAGLQTLYDWRVDENNRITLTLDTDSTKVGTLTLTIANGGSTATISTTAELTPGINEPFNVAIVATSNELGIALDGTAETRVSHTIGLPDLETSDATLSGMGTRSLVRAWSEDLSNSGQESASS